MLSKQLLSVIAVALTVFAYYPYIRSIGRNEIRPHVFSWVIWGVTTVIVFFAALQADGGAGAWVIGISGVIAIFIAFLALQKKGDIHITKTDWLFFLAAISSLPIWYFTSDPVWSVVILTLVDVLGFGPTIRKAYDQPYSEPTNFYALFAVRNVIVMFALESYSVTTVLFPAATGAACLLLVLMIYLRRSAGPEQLD